jgi:molybdopterin-binding protein
MLNAQEAADLLRLNVKRVQRLAHAGLLPAVRVGRKWLFRREDLNALLSPKPEGRAPRLGGVSARNHLEGVVVGLALDGLMAEVRLKIGDQEIVALITSSSAQRLGLAIGSRAYALVKSTDVLIGIEGDAS